MKLDLGMHIGLYLVFFGNTGVTSVGPWDYSTWVTRHQMAWGARTTVEEYSDRKLCMSVPCRELLDVPDYYSLP
jgi:hypothetical protein